MSKKYVGGIVSSIGLVGISLLYSIAKAYRIIAKYELSSTIKIMFSSFFIPSILITLVLILGIYLLIKGLYKDFDDFTLS